MLIRRLTSRSFLTSPPSLRRARGNRSEIGMTIWLETMIDRAMVATITIDVADEKPPMKANSASPSWPCPIGRVSTNMSGFEPLGSAARPAIAIGRVNRLIRNR